MTVAEQALREALTALGLLMIPVGIAVVWCVGRGVRAWIRERRAMRRLRARGRQIADATGKRTSEARPYIRTRDADCHGLRPRNDRRWSA